jgi:hypothetical protein
MEGGGVRIEGGVCEKARFGGENVKNGGEKKNNSVLRRRLEPYSNFGHSLVYTALKGKFLQECKRATLGAAPSVVHFNFKGFCANLLVTSRQISLSHYVHLNRNSCITQLQEIKLHLHACKLKEKGD